MRRVLVVAYYFPPLGGAGVQRTLKFVKHMTERGFLPEVLTVRPGCVRKNKDASLLKDVPSGLVVHRTPTLDPDYLYKALYGFRAFRLVEWLNRRVFAPDIQSVWSWMARPTLDRLLRQSRPDLLYVSGMPFSAFTLAAAAARKHKLPLVFDFRDEWTTNPGEHRAIPISDRERAMERDALSAASGVSVISPLMRDHLCAAYPRLAERPMEIIPNGYDEEDFYGLPTDPPRNPEMRIVFTGTLYGSFVQVFRNLVEGVQIAVDSGRIPSGGVRIDVIGKNVPRSVLPNGSQFVTFHGYLPHRESIRRMTSADLLLMTIGSDPGHASLLSGKMYEYLRVGRPILGIVPGDGEAAAVLRETRCGIVPDNDSPEALANTLISCYSLWKKGELSVEPAAEVVRRYDRRAQTGRLTDLFERVLADWRET
jgi:glycosyltransferase involved in cell wall biosynthesis